MATSMEYLSKSYTRAVLRYLHARGIYQCSIYELHSDKHSYIHGRFIKVLYTSRTQINMATSMEDLSKSYTRAVLRYTQINMEDLSKSYVRAALRYPHAEGIFQSPIYELHSDKQRYIDGRFIKVLYTSCTQISVC